MNLPVIPLRFAGRRVASLVLVGLAVAVPFSAFLAFDIAFPDNKGFVRTISYIRPVATGDPGYFLIVDEFSPGTTQEVVFHSYGELAINEPAGKVLFNQSGTCMQLQFPGQPVAITNHSNWVYASYPGSPANDLVDYVKVRPLGGALRLVTIVSFANASIPFPQVAVDAKPGHLLLTVEHATNDTVVLPLPAAPSVSDVIEGPKRFTGRFMVSRVNASAVVEWVLVDTCARLEVNAMPVHAGAPVSGLHHNGGTGLVVASNGTGSPSPTIASIPFDPALLEGLSSPFLLFSEAGLSVLRDKCLNTNPWQAWYAALGTGSVLNKAFKGRVGGDQGLVDQAVAAILAIDELSFDWINEQFISMSTTLYPYLHAYDMVHPNTSLANRTLIESRLMPKLEVLADAIASGSMPTNNHIVVASAALGIGGLLFKNATWVQLTQDANDFYLKERVRPHGPCYEGDVYGRYTYDQAIQFFTSLRKVGGYDYFTNPRFHAFLNYTVASVTPSGWTPSFEDCAVKQHLGSLASIAMFPVHATNPVLAANLQWYVEYCYGSPDAGADVYRIVSYESPISPVQPDLGGNQGFSYFDSGLTVFRSGWSRGSTYLVISNKNYKQSHVHLDENSIEVYALGVKFLTNPGYPHWRQEGHDYTISTEGSNTVLINGEGQLDTVSDGFTSALLDGVVDYLHSPAHRAYKSPFHPSQNPVLVVAVVVAGAALAMCAVLAWGVTRAPHLRGRFGDGA